MRIGSLVKVIATEPLYCQIFNGDEGEIVYVTLVGTYKVRLRDCYGYFYEHELEVIG